MSYKADKEEKKILKFWEENNSFEKSVEERSEDKPYVFYDGPPFATGLPHYGHIVASAMKDAVPRYWTMKGCRVERRWGWDCHGLPIENMIEQDLNLDTKKDIEEYGVEAFNQKAREAVMKYSDQWKQIIPRIGRWVDMENDYKTMDKDYMETVWWVFKQLWDRDYVYKGKKPMHICPRCSTPLAQGEVAQGYKEVKDLSVTAKFKVREESIKENKELSDLDCDVRALAWTTTPWTFPGNVLLAVGEDIEYSVVKFEDECYIVAKERLMDVFEDKEFELVRQVSGSDLVGLRYEPLFPYFDDVENAENAFKVVSSDFVDTEEGTGIVHIAPAFGEEDYDLYQELDEEIPFVQHVTMEGKFTDDVTDFAGQAVKTAAGHPEDHPGEPHQKADIQIIKWLYHHGDKLFDKQKITHRYPHCWRCDTPLLNYATESWFIEVSKVKDKLLENNQKINWIPEHVKEGRFGSWLEGARDWAVSRNRYWGAPIPIWESEDGDKICIGSTENLEELTGEEVEDLHSHVVDDLTFEKDGKTYKRTSEVFDCWFESGSMPYAQQHYPFENKEKFEKGFPAEFIAEGQDQTRGWFYTLHVLATMLTLEDDSAISTDESQPAFKNVIVNGMVLAEDGKKMSKSLGNYPDPMQIVEDYGADALRYYLLSSPVMRSEKLRFEEDGVKDVYNKVINMIDNIHNFYSMFEDEVDSEYLQGTDPTEDIEDMHVLDRWVIAKLNQLIKEVTKEMDEYHLEKATRPIQDFILDLSQWYVRRSRSRFKGDDEQDKKEAMVTLRYVFENLFKVMAPFTPFIVENLYQKVTNKEESVHLQDWPEYDEELIDEKVLDQTETVRRLSEMGQSLRQQEGVKVRQALSQFAVGDVELNEDLKEVLADELNVHEVMQNKTEAGEWVQKEEGGFVVALNTEITEELEKEGAFRELVRNINRMRKKEGLSRDDIITLEYDTGSEFLEEVLDEYEDELKNRVQAEDIVEGEGEEGLEVKDEKIKISIRQ